MKTSTMIVLVGEEELKQMNETEAKRKLSILKCLKFWRSSREADNSWTNSFEDVQNGGICIRLSVVYVRIKMNVEKFGNIGCLVNYL